MNKPVVAALNGVTAGAGASMAFACDVRILVEGAGINLAFAAHRPVLRHRVLVVAAPAGRHRQGQGAAAAAAHRRRATSASASGWSPRSSRRTSSSRRSPSWPATLAAGPTLAYGSIRRAVAASAGQDLETALAHEAELMTLTGASADHRAAVDAFLAKEKPVFEGR